MSEEDDSQKTEDPSGRKLGKAREEGQVVQSQEVKHWAMLVGGAGMLIFMAPKISRDVALVGRRFIASADSIPTDFEHLRLVMADVLIEIGVSMAPLFGMFVVIAVCANVFQFGLLWSVQKIEPKPDKLNPLSGLKKIFGTQSVMEFLKGILKLTMVSIVTFGLSVPMLKDLDVLPAISTAAALERLREIAILMALASAGVMTVIAALDYVYQHFNFMKQMRMSKQEVKEEHKQTEGDPQIKARIRAIRMDRARKRMMANVPKADVVITNPTHYAIALEYKMETMPAPKVVAKGQDFIALKIREIAEENEVPIVENPPLARALYGSVELDQEIPPEHFKAVAEVIGYVMRLKGKLAR